MSEPATAIDRRADVEDHLSGILVERDQPWVGAVPEVHVVAEQRDAVQALPATLHLGVEFPHQFGLLVPDVEFPVLLVLVAHIHEAVFDQRRKILVALARTIGVAQGGHELDLEVGDVALVDLGQRRVIPIAVVAHPHQPVLRLGRSIQEPLIGVVSAAAAERQWPSAAPAINPARPTRPELRPGIVIWILPAFFGTRCSIIASCSITVDATSLWCALWTLATCGRPRSGYLAAKSGRARDRAPPIRDHGSTVSSGVIASLEVRIGLDCVSRSGRTQQKLHEGAIGSTFPFPQGREDDIALVDLRPRRSRWIDAGYQRRTGIEKSTLLDVAKQQA